VAEPGRLRSVFIASAVAVLCAAPCSVAAVSIGEARRSLPDGSPVSFPAVAVTAIFPGCVYVQQPDRSCAVRVQTAETLSVGEVADVSGTIETDAETGERYVAAFPGHPHPAGASHPLKALGISGKAFVGGDSGLQKGIAGKAGLNTIGLLVRVWGKVGQTGGQPGETRWFMLQEPGGPAIKAVVPTDVPLDPDWESVAAAGICTVERLDGQMAPVLRVRGAADITPIRSHSEIRMQSMTLDEKIGQMFQVRVSGDEMNDSIRELIETQHIGGIIYFQYNGNLNDPVRSARFSNDLQACAMGTDGKGIPLLLSTDQEGGRVTRITGGCDFPGNMGLGAARSELVAQQAAAVMGREIRAVGAQMDLAPVLDVNNNPANPVIGVRSFGEEPGLVSDLGRAYVRGLQSAGVLATAKHFPGHGDTHVDSHTGLPVVDYDFTTLDTVHGRPFRETIAAGLDAVMTAHIVVNCLDPERPATLSPAVIDGYLRGSLGFDGVVMTDSMGMAGITSGYSIEDATVMAVNAGVDLLSLPPDLDRAIAALKAAVQSGEIPESRIDQAVARILRLKQRCGLFSDPFVDADAAGQIVGCSEHRAVEADAAHAAVTLVQNTGGLLPLSLAPQQKLLLVTVQSSETSSDAAQRFAGFISQKHPNTVSMAIEHSPGATAATRVINEVATSDAVIIGTSRAQLYPKQAVLVRDISGLGKPVIIAGLREPYELASFPDVSAYLAVYNSRDCGFRAAADCIFGDASPSGLLPVSIPGSYPFGHGLSY